MELRYKTSYGHAATRETDQRGHNDNKQTILDIGIDTDIDTDSDT